MTGALVLLGIVSALGGALWAVLHRFDLVRLWPAGLLLLTAPLEVYRTSVGPFNLSVFRLALVLAVLAVAIGRLRAGPLRMRRVLVPLPLLIYGALVALQLASVAWVTPAASLGTKFLLQYAGGLVAASVIATTVRRDDVKALCAVVLAAGFLPAIASVWRVLAAGGSQDRTLPGLSLLPVDRSIAAARESGSFLLDGTQRMQGTFGDPNHFAFFMVVVLVVAAAWTAGSVVERARPLSWRWFTGLVAVTAALLVLASYSRSAWLYAAVALLAVAALAGRPVRRRLVTPPGAAALLVVVGGVIALTGPGIADRLDPARSGNEISTDAHLATMRLAIDLAADHPLDGVGLGGYGTYAGQPALVSSAHSTLLTTAAELGLPGLLLLLAAMAAVTAAGVRAALATPGGTQRLLLAALVASYGAMAVANVAYEVWMDDFQWTLFGVLLAVTTQPALELRRRTVVWRSPRGEGRTVPT